MFPAMHLLHRYRGVDILGMNVGFVGIITTVLLLFSWCNNIISQEICYQYWPGSSSETEKNGEFSVTMLEMVNRDGFVQRLISITDPKARHM